jgi:hypothetical protein
MTLLKISYRYVVAAAQHSDIAAEATQASPEFSARSYTSMMYILFLYTL